MTVVAWIVWIIIGVISGSVATWIVMREQKKDRERGPFGGRHDEEVFDRQPPEMASEADLPPEEEDDEDEYEDEGEDLQEMLRSGGRFQPGTVIDEDVDLTDFEHDGDLNLDGVIFQGDVRAKSLQLAGKLSLRGATVHGTFDCEDGEVGSLDLTGADFKNTCELPSVNGETCLKDVKVGGELYLNQRSFGGCFDAENLRVEEGFGAEGAEFTGLVFLKNIRVGGDLDLDETSMLALDIQEAEIDGDCRLRNASVKDSFIRDGALVHGELIMEGNDIDIFPEMTVKGGINF